MIDPIRELEGDLVQGITQSQALPVSIPGDGEPVTASLPMGDDLPAAGRNGRLTSADLRIHLGDPKAIDAVDVSLNGGVLAIAERDFNTGWFSCCPKPEQYRQGRNEVTFRATRVAADGKSIVDVTHVEVQVRYK